MPYDPSLLVDPPASSSLEPAITWIESAALGTVATVIAVIAMAGLGLMLMAGRTDVRRGVTVILGCFFVFGAHAIAAGLVSQSASPTNRSDEDQSLITPAISTGIFVPTTDEYDPYAGASVPTQP